ncbi:MAG: gentisate 1,2-dioxygenase [Burkholderiaceae bacterium]|nr:gentisate 1,2-dioxygenase [Ideonella sp.]MCC7286708.1 gentisate 1,2-dioxygenase [Burkholderiaceae bacterium]
MAARPDPHAPVAAEREAYYAAIRPLHLSPLWEQLHTLVPPQPATPCAPVHWRYDALRPHLMRAGTLITAAEAVRRVLVLENPALPGRACATQSLFAGLQMILPGEVAPAHRHTQSALRFIVEGRGAYTAVNGERATMAPGDFIITPSWTWHDHGSDADGPVVWLDGLDIPLVRFLDAGFAENLGSDQQPISRPEGHNLARYGSNMAPLREASPHGATSPIFSYPYARSRDALARLARDGALDAWDGAKLQYINPASGGAATPTMAAFLQLLPAGFDGRPYRQTDGAVFSVVEGRGVASIGEGTSAQRFEFAPRDHFVVPSWQTLRLQARDECVLFSFSDRPVQLATALWREQRLQA